MPPSVANAFEAAKQHFAGDVGHFEAGDFANALVRFRASLVLLPDWVSTLGNLGATLIKLRQPAAALAHLTRALALDGNNFDLPPPNRTSHFSKKPVSMENDGHENEQVQRRADHWLLRQAEAGMPVKEVGRKHGFSDASFYKWRSKYGGMDASEDKRLRELELENGKLKRLLAEAHLDIHALKSVFGIKLVI